MPARSVCRAKNLYVVQNVLKNLGKNVNYKKIKHKGRNSHEKKYFKVNFKNSFEKCKERR